MQHPGTLLTLALCVPPSLSLQTPPRTSLDVSDPLARELSRSPQPNAAAPTSTEDRPTRPKPPQSPTIAALQVAFNAGNPAAAAAAAAAAQSAADRDRDDSGLSGSLPVILPPALVSASGAFDAPDNSNGSGNMSALNARRTPSGRMSAPGDLPGSSNRDTQAARYGGGGAAAAAIASRQRSQRYEDSSGVISREALHALSAGGMESPAGSPPLGGGGLAAATRMYAPGLAATTGREAPQYGLGLSAAYGGGGGGDGGGRYPGVAIAGEQRPLPPVPYSPMQGHGGTGGDALGMYDTRGNSFRSLRHSTTALAEEVIAGGGGAGCGRAPPYMFYNTNGVMPGGMGYPGSGDLGPGPALQSYFTGPGGGGPPDGGMWGDQQELFIPGPGGPYGGGGPGGMMGVMNSEGLPGGADMGSRRPSYVGVYDYPALRSARGSFYGEGDMGDGDGTGGVGSG